MHLNTVFQLLTGSRDHNQVQKNSKNRVEWSSIFLQVFESEKKSTSIELRLYRSLFQ